MSKKSYFDDPVWQQKIDRLMDLIRKGIHIDTACKKIGLTRKTFYKWLEDARAGKSERHIEFARRVDEANADFEINVFDEIFKIGKGEKVWTALAWVMERKYPERYSPPGQQIKIVQEVSNQLEVLLKEVEKFVDPATYARLVNHLAQSEEDREDPFISEEGSPSSEVTKIETNTVEPLDEETISRIKTFGREQ